MSMLSPPQQWNQTANHCNEPFDIHEILQRKRQRHVVLKDSQIHGSDASSHRLFGVFSSPDELDALHKELQLSPRAIQAHCAHPGNQDHPMMLPTTPASHYSFHPIQKDPLLHGGTTAVNKLNGYFSSADKLDELEKLKFKHSSYGRKGGEWMSVPPQNRQQPQSTSTHPSSHGRQSLLKQEEEALQVMLDNRKRLDGRPAQRAHDIFGQPNQVHSRHSEPAPPRSEFTDEVSRPTFKKTNHDSAVPLHSASAFPFIMGMTVQQPTTLCRARGHCDPAPLTELDLLHSPMGVGVPEGVLAQRQAQLAQGQLRSPRDLQGPRSRLHLAFNLQGFPQGSEAIRANEQWQRQRDLLQQKSACPPFTART